MSVTEAKAKFSELVEIAIAGESIVITKQGRPVAKIVPLAGRNWFLVPMQKKWLSGETSTSTASTGSKSFQNGKQASWARRSNAA